MDSSLAQKNEPPAWKTAYAAWQKQPGPQTTTQLLDAVQPTITKAVKSYLGKEDPLAISRARRMALDAFKSYDAEKSQLPTHLTNHLKGLMRYQQQRTNIIGVPEKLMLDRHHLYTVANELSDRLGREPTDLELADAATLSLKRIAHIRKYAQESPQSAYETEDAEDGAAPPAVTEVGEPQQSHWLNMLYQSVGPRDQLILEHTVPLGNKRRMANNELARRIGVTPAAVSQRKAKLHQMLNELRQRMES